MPSTASVEDPGQWRSYVRVIAETAFKDGQFRTAAVLWLTSVAAKGGARPLAIHRLGQALDRLGQYEQTAALAVRLRKTHPEHPWATKTILRQLLSQGRHVEARRMCHALLAAPGIAADLKCGMAVQLGRAGDITGAFRIADALLEERPEDPKARHAAITLAAEHGHFRRALSLLHGSEPNREGLVLLARIYRALQHFADCERICANGLAKFPDDTNLLYQWASSAHAQEHWLTAYRRWRALAEVEPSRLEAWLNMAHALEERGHPAHAERLLRKTIACFPHSSLPRRALARFLHARGRKKAAERCYLHIRCAGLATVESDIEEAAYLADQGRRAEARRSYAALVRKGRKDHRILRAIAIAQPGAEASAVLLRRAIMLNEGDYESRAHLARFLVRRGRLAEAQERLACMAGLFGDRVDHFRLIAAELKQVSPLAHTLIMQRSLHGDSDRIGLGALCAALLDQKRLTEAEAVVRRLERLQGSTAIRLRTMLLVEQKRLPEAEQIAAPAFRREPWSAPAQEALADVLTRLGRQDELRVLLQKTGERYRQRLSTLVQAVAKAAWASGDKLLALSLRQLAVGLFARSGQSELALGQTSISLAQNEPALSLFQRLDGDYSRALDVMTEVGTLLLRQGRIEAGLGCLTRAAADQPVNALRWLNLALASSTAGDPAGVSSALLRVGRGGPGGALAVMHAAAPADVKEASGQTATDGGMRKITYRKAEPLVAVVVSAYNAGDTIEASLASVLAQSYRNIEVLVVDDSSTDDTARKVEGLSSRDSRVKLIRLPENQGTYVARNAGIEQIGAEYLTFQDADDASVSERIEMQMDCLRSGNALCVYGGYCRVNEDGSLDARSMLPAQRDLAMAPVTALMRRRLLASIGYFDSVRVGADMEHYHRIRLAHGAQAAAFIRQPLLLAGSRKGSLSNNPATGHNWRTVARAPLTYERNYKRWHAACIVEGKTPYVSYPLRDRPFPVPRALLP